LQYRHIAKLPRNKNTTDKLLQVPQVTANIITECCQRFANTLKKMNAYGSKRLNDFAAIN
jgi:hypothetical protein